MVSAYPLPEGFSDFDVFSLGSCLLVEGKHWDWVCDGLQPETMRCIVVVVVLIMCLTHDRTRRPSVKARGIGAARAMFTCNACVITSAAVHMPWINVWLRSL